MTNNLGLIADIGATNARFALADDKGFYKPENLKCEDYPTILDAVHAYLGNVGVKNTKMAVFSMAGPVGGDTFEMTNNPWRFSIEQTRRSMGWDKFELFNDFESIAFGIPYLEKDGYAQVGATSNQKSMELLVLWGQGLGLGLPAFFWDGTSYRANAGEGGHVTMPAKTQREFDLFRTLRYKYSHVSAERVCSGKGLVNIYTAIRILDGHEKTPDRTSEEIAQAAIDQTCPICEEALDKMMGFLGTVAGDLALSLGSMGGIYIAGGIPAKLGDYFLNSRFRKEFESKGRFGDYLKKIPTFLVKDPYVAFRGLQNHIKKFF